MQKQIENCPHCDVVPRWKLWLRSRGRAETGNGRLRKSKIYTDKTWFERMWSSRCREATRANGWDTFSEWFVVGFETDNNGKWIEIKRFGGGEG